MLGTQNLLAFIMAGLMLNLIPGPDTLYILGRSLSQGRRAGVLSVLGISSGVLCHVFAVAFGLSALWTASATAFTIVKIMGAAYLIYLGIRTLLDTTPLSKSPVITEVSFDAGKIYRQGLITNLLNPKVSLFIMAFLPQFVRPEAHLGAIPFLFLGGIFVFNGTVWCLFVAYFSAAATTLIRKNQRFELLLKRLTGSLFIGLGVNLLRAKIKSSV